MLEETSKKINMLNPPTSRGSFPVSPMSEINNVFSSSKFPISDGKVVEKLFFEKDMSVKLSSFPTSVGISPVNRLLSIRTEIRKYK